MGEVARELGAHGGVRAVRPSLGQDFVRAVEEGEGGQDGGGLAVGDVAGGAASSRARVVHRRQVVQDQARGVHHLDGGARGQHAPRIGAEDLRHHEGHDGTQPLGGREEAVLERGLHRGRAPGPGQPPQRFLDLPPAVLERGLERAERAASAHARDVTPEAHRIALSSERRVHPAASELGGSPKGVGGAIRRAMRPPLN
jgi:hypothetical protein